MRRNINDPISSWVPLQGLSGWCAFLIITNWNEKGLFAARQACVWSYRKWHHLRPLPAAQRRQSYKATVLECHHKLGWIVTTVKPGSLLDMDLGRESRTILNSLKLLTRRNHWIQLELWVKTGPDLEKAEIKFLDARQHCFVAMLNFLLATFCSLDGFCGRVFSLAFLENDFSDFQGHVSDVPNSKTALILSVLETQSSRDERIWESPCHGLRLG